MSEQVTLCLPLPPGHGSLREPREDELPTGHTACTSLCPALSPDQVSLEAVQNPAFRPPPHLGHARGCLRPGGFVVGTDFRKPLHMIPTDTGICKVNTNQQRRAVCKSQCTQPQVLKARQTRKEGQSPAGDPELRTPARGGGSPKTLTRVRGKKQ